MADPAGDRTATGFPWERLTDDGRCANPLCRRSLGRRPAVARITMANRGGAFDSSFCLEAWVDLLMVHVRAARRGEITRRLRGEPAPDRGTSHPESA